MQTNHNELTYNGNVEAINYAKAGNYAKSIDIFNSLIKIDPSNFTLYNNLGKVLRQKGDLNAAIAAFRYALQIKINYPEAHNNLGACLYRQGIIHDAIEHFLRAIMIYPDFIDAHYNLANCYIHKNRPHDAIAHYLKVINFHPEHQNALHNLGILLTNLKQFDQATIYLTKAIDLDPTDLDAKFHLGVIFDATYKENEAIATYLSILDVTPNDHRCWHNLATIYLRQDKKELALIHYKKAYALNDKNNTALHLINSLEQNNPPTAPQDYISALFNQYATNYDLHVTEQLQYQAPFLLRSAIGKLLDHLPKPCYALDLGCGTGLCGRYFSDLCDKLIGVDLAEDMLTIAKETGFYTKLKHADLIDILKEQQEYYQLILAADVFVYCGDLLNIFKGCNTALADNGLLAFTIELQSSPVNNISNYTYQLQTNGRYSHSIEYITQLAKDTGFIILTSEIITLRQQHQQPVTGALLVLKKSI